MQLLSWYWNVSQFEKSMQNAWQFPGSMAGRVSIMSDGRILQSFMVKSSQGPAWTKLKIKDNEMFSFDKSSNFTATLHSFSLVCHSYLLYIYLILKVLSYWKKKMPCIKMEPTFFMILVKPINEITYVAYDTCWSLQITILL